MDIPTDNPQSSPMKSSRKKPLLAAVGIGLAVIIGTFFGPTIFDSCSRFAFALGPSQSARTECLMTKAQKTQNVSFCFKIIGPDRAEFLPRCASDVALAKKDINVCDKLSSAPTVRGVSQSQECREWFTTISTDQQERETADAEALTWTKKMQLEATQQLLPFALDVVTTFHIGYAGDACTRQYFLKVLANTQRWVDLSKEQKTAVVKILMTIASVANEKHYAVNVLDTKGREGYAVAEKKCGVVGSENNISILK